MDALLTITFWVILAIIIILIITIVYLFKSLNTNKEIEKYEEQIELLDLKK